MDYYFHLQANGITARKEILCGFTTFLTMSYILFLNPAIVAEVGMPVTGVFVATALSTAACTIIMALFSNTPFAMAPGMGLNTFFTYSVCVNMGFHWKEALAVTFLAGVLLVVIMASPLRKTLVLSIPTDMRIATSVGLGLFIGYIGMKNADFISFTSSPGQYTITENGSVISNGSIVPSIVGAITPTHLLAIISLGIMCVLLTFERKTGESYAALAAAMLTATFIGIPLNITNLAGVSLMDFSQIGELRHVFFSFWGRPGLLSLLDDPIKILMAVLAVCVILVTSLVDSIGSLIGVGRIEGAEIFDDEDISLFTEKKMDSKLDKAIVSNSMGTVVGSVFGTTTMTTYVESITGIVSGGRTGLTGLVVGLMFLACLPLSSFFSVVPTAAIAPALIVSGSYMMTLVTRINWKNFEDYFPAFITIVTIPSSFGIMDGIACGTLCHIVIQIALGKWRKIPVMLYIIGAVYVIIKISQIYLKF